jgi:hypothetical protein
MFITNMKNNQTRISEALGVPDNLYETALQVYDKLLRATKKLQRKEDFENFGARLFFRGQFQIADFPFTGIKFQLGIEENKRAKEPDIVSMTIRSESKKGEIKLEPIVRKTLDLLMILVVPKNFDYTTLPEFFISHKNEIVEDLSHELKHAYDHFKKPTENVVDRSSYQAIVAKQMGVPALNTFLHDLYFISAIENLVRPSEIAAAIKNNQVSQKEFLNFLRNNDTYLNLRRISQFNLNDLKMKLKSEMKSIDRLLKGLGLDIDDMSEKKKINAVLKLLWVNITNWKNDALKEVLTTSFFEELFGFEGEKDRFFKKIVGRNLKFKNYQEFYNFHQQNFHYVANQMIKKIAKLYAITKKS